MLVRRLRPLFGKIKRMKLINKKNEIVFDYPSDSLYDCLKAANNQNKYLGVLKARESNLDGCDLSECRIDGDFKHSSFIKSKFTNSIIYGDYKHSQFQWAKFDYANINGKFEYCNFMNCSFKRSNITYAQFDSAEMRWCDFRRSNLRYSNFFGSHLTGSDFREANLIDVNFSNAIMYQVKLAGAIISNDQNKLINILKDVRTPKEFNDFVKQKLIKMMKINLQELDIYLMITK